MFGELKSSRARMGKESGLESGYGRQVCKAPGMGSWSSRKRGLVRSWGDSTFTVGVGVRGGAMVTRAGQRTRDGPSGGRRS